MSAVYRGCSLGDALVDALDVLVTEGKIDGPLAGRVMQSYDEVMAVRLSFIVVVVMTFTTRAQTPLTRGFDTSRKQWRKR